MGGISSLDSHRAADHWDLWGGLDSTFPKPEIEGRLAQFHCLDFLQTIPLEKWQEHFSSKKIWIALRYATLFSSELRVMETITPIGRFHLVGVIEMKRSQPGHMYFIRSKALRRWKCRIRLIWKTHFHHFAKRCLQETKYDSDLLTSRLRSECRDRSLVELRGGKGCNCLAKGSGLG